VQKQVPLANLADRAKAYGIPSYSIDGNDAPTVYTTAREAVARCRAGEGPILIEAKTMRMKGHAQHDAAEYVPKEMFAYWKARDPITRYEKLLTDEKLLTAKSKAEIESRINKQIEEDREFAENSPQPPPELAEQGVYCDGCHTVAAKWERSKKDVMPPKSSVAPLWKVRQFGAYQQSAPRNSASEPAAGGNGVSREGAVKTMADTSERSHARQASAAKSAKGPAAAVASRASRHKVGR
jgi:hypothetical protein